MAPVLSNGQRLPEDPPKPNPYFIQFLYKYIRAFEDDFVHFITSGQKYPTREGTKKVIRESNQILADELDGALIYIMHKSRQDLHSLTKWRFYDFEQLDFVKREEFQRESEMAMAAEGLTIERILDIVREVRTAQNTPFPDTTTRRSL